MLLTLLQCGFVLAVPLQVVHAVLPTLILQPKIPHFPLQVLQLMPFLHGWCFSAALGHVLDGSFDCDFVVAAGIERNVDGEVVFGDRLYGYFYAFLLEMRLELLLDCLFFQPVDVELDVVIGLRFGQHFNRLFSLSLFLRLVSRLRMHGMHNNSLLLMLHLFLFLILPLLLFFILGRDLEMQQCLLIMHMLPWRNCFLYSSSHDNVLANATIISMMDHN